MFSFRSGPTQDRPASTGNRSAEGRRVKSCFACSPTGGLNWDATTVSKSAQTKWPTHRINTFAYANRAAPGRARKQRKLLTAKTFAYANAAFAYTNPNRGDVSPLRLARRPGSLDGEAVRRYRLTSESPRQGTKSLGAPGKAVTTSRVMGLTTTV